MFQRMVCVADAGRCRSRMRRFQQQSLLVSRQQLMGDSAIAVVDKGYSPRTAVKKPQVQQRKNLSRWSVMPSDIKVNILTSLKPQDIVRSSRVSKDWHRICYDGQLWSTLDAAEFYQDVPGPALTGHHYRQGRTFRKRSQLTWEHTTA
jgi:hypothetical protein